MLPQFPLRAATQRPPPASDWVWEERRRQSGVQAEATVQAAAAAKAEAEAQAQAAERQAELRQWSLARMGLPHHGGPPIAGLTPTAKGKVKRLLVVGEAGDGKSTLINALRDPAKSEEAAVGFLAHSSLFALR